MLVQRPRCGDSRKRVEDGGKGRDSVVHSKGPDYAIWPIDLTQQVPDGKRCRAMTGRCITEERNCMDAVSRRISLFVALGCAAAALVLPSGASAVVDASISGVVTDASTTSPIAGACVG